MEGSFDNAAGFSSCLCAGFPFALWMASGTNRLRRLSGLVAAAVILVAVVLSDYRSGWAAMAVSAVWFLLRCHRKAPGGEGLAAVCSLVSVGVFAMFSYPFSYPFVWITSAVSAAVLILRAYPQSCRCLTARLRRPAAVLLMLCSMSLFVCVCKRTAAETEWGWAAAMAERGDASGALARYSVLMKELGGNPYFLYNYSAELYLAGRLRESLVVATLCGRLWADYDLCILSGTLNAELGRPDSALASYRRARLMCPSRFTPLYGMYHVYKTTGDSVSACRMAGEIARKPVKIMTDEISEMIDEVREDACVTDNF